MIIARLRHSVLVQLLLVLALCTPLHSEPPLWLQLTITLKEERDSYSLSDEIDAMVAIKNRGAGPVFLYKKITWGYPGTFLCKVFYQDGREVKDRFVSDDWMMPGNEPQRDPESLVRLLPGQSFEFRTVFPIRMMVREPGNYVVKMRYLAPFDWGEYEGIPVWGNSDGPLFASFRLKVE